MAMLISVMSFAETESITLSSGTHDGSKITWTAANGNITISQLKAASSTAVNASYIAAPRMYKGHILKFECAEGYGITNIDITYNGSYYGTSLFAGTTMTSTTVTANTTDLTSTFATTSDGTHKIVATNAAGEKLIALQIPNNAASGYKQLRPTAIKVTYAKAASSTPAIACGDVNFGTVPAANTNTKELEVVGENLTEVITATLEEGSAFSVSGSLDETGGTLTVTVTATEEGQYTDQLTLTSGTTTKTVAISAKVVACQGKGTKEEPYTIGDLTKLANPGTKAWVMGYIIGEIKDNELSTSGFENNSNIALADAIGETKKYAPIQLPSGAIRDALNLVSNPANLNKQVALYGTLEAYFSMPGVKSVSEYEWVVAPVVNHTITVSANPAEAGTVTGGGEYEEGATATLTATANEGYEFVNWTENEVEVSTDAEYTFEVLADRNLVANFIKKTISYELNGGAFPKVKVPTNEELALVFKQEYAEYFAIEGLTDTDMKREVGNFIYVTNSKGGDAIKFITENANWKWLHDYILTVAGNIPEGTNVGYYWRANIDGFFHCKNAVLVGGVASADFTEAGKPEAWGAAYQAAHAVVLPTEPVAEDYVLPTPVKTGYTFVGWYDNEEGTGEAYTVIPAGWSGTLYAIWEAEGPATALDNIAIEGKVVKTIINGQLIIINNGVQYNALGQVIR